ncbi:hypothetical protein SNE40_022319 [Patella caerulea]|uniref:EGF-like domain-containing protein n=1 Tax=Patella caerulea TaxID=87958 RepID=A0AAN8FW61_PATCE
MCVTLWIALILTTVVTACGGVCESCCQMNACLPNPCENNGTCSPVDKGYICNCATGYLGKLCDVNPCDIYNPCKNNGRCYPSEFGVSCSCPPGFIGESCQDSEDITLVVVEERVCDVTECKARGGRCAKQRCQTDVNNCGGKACTANNEVCIDDTCVNYGDNCGTIDGIFNACTRAGEKCGNGKFCSEFDKCVNDTCRPKDQCTDNNGDCSVFSATGTCSGGACLATCVEDKACGGWRCRGGFCAVAKCGETYCRLLPQL